MSVDQHLVGRSFPAASPYQVTAPSVAEFAAAVGCPWQEGQEPPATFPIVVAFRAMTELMHDESVGIELENVVRGDQRFVHHRPVQVGDRLTVDSVRFLRGTDIIATTSAITDVAGELVCEAKATLLHTDAMQVAKREKSR